MKVKRERPGASKDRRYTIKEGGTISLRIQTGLLPVVCRTRGIAAYLAGKEAAASKRPSPASATRGGVYSSCRFIKMPSTLPESSIIVWAGKMPDMIPTSSGGLCGQDDFRWQRFKAARLPAAKPGDHQVKKTRYGLDMGSFQGRDQFRSLAVIFTLSCILII